MARGWRDQIIVRLLHILLFQSALIYSRRSLDLRGSGPGLGEEVTRKDQPDVSYLHKISNTECKNWHGAGTALLTQAASHLREMNCNVQKTPPSIALASSHPQNFPVSMILSTI